MKQSTEMVLDWIGLSEGGYTVDKGGPTDRGVTQRAYDAWNRANGTPLRPVKGISKATADRIFVEEYFAPVRFDDLPAGIDYAVADFSVNSGPAQAAKTLQRCLGVTPDGIIGARTLAAIADRDPITLIADYCGARMAFLRGLSNWPRNRNGWTVRVMGHLPGAQRGDIGVVDRATKLARGAADIPAPTVVAPSKADPAASVGFWGTLRAKMGAWA